MITATLSPCRGFVEMAGPTWSDRYPVARLPDWLAFYRRLRDRMGGRYAAIYAPAVAALEAVARELAESPPQAAREGAHA